MRYEVKKPKNIYIETIQPYKQFAFTYISCIYKGYNDDDDDDDDDDKNR